MIPILRLLRSAAGSDRDLLDRYVHNRDEKAFEALVRRYGAGVWAACVRLAGHDSDDAFQAVFLTLARKAGTVTGSLPAWLHAVTRRVASTARRGARRRAAGEAAAARPEPVACADPSLREGLALVDEELSRLPEAYRAVLIVCCLEGRSRDEAAAHLGWSEGQVKGRLERAREMLRVRLSGRGLELGGLLTAAVMAGPAPVRAAAPSAAAINLTNGVIRAMLILKFKLVFATLAACVALAGGVVLWARAGDPAGPDGGVNVTPTNRAGAAGLRGKGRAAPHAQDDESKREIEGLRRRVDALEKKLVQPAPDRRKVVVSVPQAKDVVINRRYVGKVRAHRHINLRALATGFVEEVLVREGQAVKKGDVLFKVTPILYRAKLDASLAEVRIVKLAVDDARGLFKQKVISQRELSLQEAKLAKAEAQAKLAEAELNFTVVRAPFDGLVGRLQNQEGGAVKEGDTLTTLSDNRVLWVYFNVPEASYLAYVATRDERKAGPPIELLLADGRKFPQAGRLGAIDGQFGNDTGNISFRADFPNPKGLLRHGQTGTLSIRETLKNAVVIPRRATFEDRDRRYVYVVDKGGVAHRREVVVGSETGDVLIITKGLDVNDRIVVEGVGQVRDGENVEYEFRKPDADVGRPKEPVEK